MGNQTAKLTEDNQGYWDRIKRARSWIERARTLETEATQNGELVDSQQLFIIYWIAFNAMYGRINETDQGRYLRPGDDDARWFLRWICDMDTGQGRIKSTLTECPTSSSSSFPSGGGATPTNKMLMSRRGSGISSARRDCSTRDGQQPMHLPQSAMRCLDAVQSRNRSSGVIGGD